MENWWQMHKIWKNVDRQKQPISPFQRDRIRWEHPAENHIDASGQITPAYWAWRSKGLKHPHWVRYPNGYKNHGLAAGSVLGDPSSGYQLIGYIEARKAIYFAKYREIALGTSEFRRLKKIETIVSDFIY